MTDSIFDTVLLPTLVGGLVLATIMGIVYVGLSIVEWVMGQTTKHQINWKNISGYFVIVCVVLAISWFLGSRIMVIYYE